MLKKRSRIIIDTNLWISYLLSNEFSKWDKVLLSKNIRILFSQELLDEFIEVAQRPKFKKYFSIEDLEHLLTQIKSKVEFISVISVVNICRDSKDNFLLSLAKDGKATHLITGDKDLLDIKIFGKTKILKINDFFLKEQL